MNDHYAKQGKYFADSEAVRQAAETLSHAELRDFFRKYVSGTDELPWDTFFAQVGLHVSKAEVTFPDSGFDAVQQFDQSPEIVKVYPATEAERSGLKPGDVIVKINGQAAGRQFETQIAKLGPGTLLHLTIRRDGVERQLEYKLGSRKQMVYQLQDVSNITAQQKARRAAWLSSCSASGQWPCRLQHSSVFPGC
jgi:predicted metalloprotease with PDZ domain